MTGIERLRRLIEDYRAGRECDGLECTALSCGKCMAKNVLEPIADQIEREADVETVRSEAMEAWRWVREHGGLDAVKKLLDWVVGHCSTKQQLDFDFWLSGRVMHELGFDEDMADRDEVERRLRARLMPEGYEWPMVDGKPVVIGERMRSCGIDDCKVVGIDPGNSRLILASDNIEEGKATYFADFAEYCHRPDPKVLDADGVEIRVGDTVCGTRDMEPMRVVDTDSRECGFKHIKCEKEGDGFWFYCADELTHKLPVLAADGKPLREGETVWDVDGRGPLAVWSLPEKSGMHVSLKKDGTFYYRHPDQLTHERPDSWERLEDDADALLKAESNGKGSYNAANDYCNAHGLGTDGTVWVLVAQDLVRRAKKLAERGGR